MEGPGISNRFNFYFILASGGLTAGLGLSVLVGWYTHIPTLIQVYSDFVAMQYNTALGFLLSGGALLALAGRKSRLALVFGAIVTLIGSLTLIQYIFDVDFRIDQLFMEHYITVKTAFPGRMAPTTAVSFVLSGLGLASLGGWENRHQMAPGILASLVMAVGLGTFMGYGLGTEAPYGWSHLSYMAVHTAGGFVVLGAGIFGHAMRNVMARQSDPPKWLPATIGIFLLTILIGLWQGLVTQEEKQIDRIVEAQVEGLSDRISKAMDLRIRALERMARRWETREAMPLREWKADATQYLTDFPGFRAIQWVGPNDRLRWTVPLDSKEIRESFKFPEWAGPSVLEDAVQWRNSVVTEPTGLAEGGKGIFVYVPLFAGNRFMGFMVGMLRIDEMIFQMVSGGTAQDYQITILSNGKKIFGLENNGHQPSPEWAKEDLVQVRNAVWRVRVQPWPD
jgi:sensor domain CHASE-containing protein